MQVIQDYRPKPIPAQRQTEVISVAVAVYNSDAYLERAVESILNQTYRNLEVILVDDGSPDGCPKICEDYAARDGRVRVIHQENQGLGYARNAGVQAAAGEYVAFLDGDDTVEPDMYQVMYQKAAQGDYDMVMCDVKIIYVEENRTSVVATYPRAEIDLADYIANGNNITYSVNKLFRRGIWQDNRYEKMLFEDIALIPALVTRYPNIGYVPRPFYHYYRRANTLSTTYTGDMVDIVQAFRNFLDTSAPAYRDEVVYCVAKQLYWNMTQSRVLFQADFIGLLKEYQKDFRLNPYLARDGKLKGLLSFLDKPVIPENLICVHLDRPIPEGYLAEIQADFPKAMLLEECPEDRLPDSVRAALAMGNTAYAGEYFALRLLCRQGGIVLFPHMRANLNLKKLRLNQVFFGFSDPDSVSGVDHRALCFPNLS